MADRAVTLTPDRATTHVADLPELAAALSEGLTHPTFEQLRAAHVFHGDDPIMANRPASERSEISFNLACTVPDLFSVDVFVDDHDPDSTTMHADPACQHADPLTTLRRCDGMMLRHALPCLACKAHETVTGALEDLYARAEAASDAKAYVRLIVAAAEALSRWCSQCAHDGQLALPELHDSSPVKKLVWQLRKWQPGSDRLHRAAGMLPDGWPDLLEQARTCAASHPGLRQMASLRHNAVRLDVDAVPDTIAVGDLQLPWAFLLWPNGRAGLREWAIVPAHMAEQSAVDVRTLPDGVEPDDVLDVLTRIVPDDSAGTNTQARIWADTAIAALT